MQPPVEGPANTEKTALIQGMVDELLAKTLRRGFFGFVAITVCIQDGVIQEIRDRIERRHH